MRGVIIVDDDAYIRQGLKLSVSWEDYGLEIVGEASNGLQALKLIEEKSPVLILTDIKMPYMTGLELLSEITKKNLQVKVIMISAYNDFDFVRKAMTLGARNYIVKPLNKIEVDNAIKTVVEELEDEAKDYRARKQGLIALRDNVLNRLVRDEISQRELTERLELLELDILDASLRIVILKFSSAIQQKNVNNIDLENFINLTLNEANPIIIFNNSNDQISLLMVEKDFYTKEAVKQIGTDLIRTISARYHLDCYVSVGCCVSNYKKINISYDEAMRGLDYKIIYGINKVIFFEDLQLIKDKKNSYFYIPKNEIKEMVLSQNREEVQKYIDVLFLSTLNESYISPDQIIFATIEILSSIYPILNAMKIETSLQSSDSLLKIIMRMDSIIYLKDWVLDQIYYVMDAIKTQKEKKFSELVNDVIASIYAHYDDTNLCLKTLSVELNVSATHLGRIFKHETNSYFSDYLNNVRIEYSKELLTKTELNTKEIAKKVGFDNINYFYTIFKKKIGMGTGEYKQMIKK
jgi:two-component system, response regulator YesN